MKLGPKVTSTRGKTNWRDRLWIAVCTTVAGAVEFLTEVWEYVWKVVVAVIALASEDIAQWLRTVDTSSMPLWAGLGTMMLIGVVMLVRRKYRDPEE